MGQADMKGDCVLVWDSCMDPLLDWPLLLGMLTGLSGIPCGNDVVCGQRPESYSSKGFFTPAQVAGCGLRLQLCACGFLSGSACASLLEQP